VTKNYILAAAIRGMVQQHTPYVYGEIDDDYDDTPGESDAPGWGPEPVIIDGRAMSVRSYQRHRNEDDGTG